MLFFSWKKKPKKVEGKFISNIWAPTRYLCRKNSCKGITVNMKVKKFEKIVAYGGRYVGGPSIPMNPITQPYFVNTRVFKCPCCHRIYYSTFFLKKRPLTETEMAFKGFIKNTKIVTAK